MGKVRYEPCFHLNLDESIVRQALHLPVQGEGGEKRNHTI